MGLTGLFTRNGPIPRREVSDEDINEEKLDPKVEREVLANLVFLAWQAFADGFREDERQHEALQFQQDAAVVFGGMQALPPDRAPDGHLQRHAMAALIRALRERVPTLHERIDDLVGTCRDRDRELNTLKLSTSWQTDELDRSRQMIMQALRGREAMLPNTPGNVQPLISELLAILLNVQRPAPKVEVHEGRRRDRTTAAENSPESNQTVAAEAEDDPITGTRRILREVVAGTASAGKLGRVLGDLELARKLADMAAENRTYRQTLQRIGLLPKDA